MMFSFVEKKKEKRQKGIEKKKKHYICLIILNIDIPLLEIIIHGSHRFVEDFKMVININFVKTIFPSGSNR
jgi:hypothetical protein